jgi:hypothetical protein
MKGHPAMMTASQFALNPIATLNHDYTCPPIGRSLWRKFVKDGDTRGIKAKTVYPPMPATWPAGECWEPDKVFAQIQAGLLNAKSIGWLPTKAHFADVKELRRRIIRRHWFDDQAESTRFSVHQPQGRIGLRQRSAQIRDGHEAARRIERNRKRAAFFAVQRVDGNRFDPGFRGQLELIRTASKFWTGACANAADWP